MTVEYDQVKIIGLFRLLFFFLSNTISFLCRWMVSRWWWWWWQWWLFLWCLAWFLSLSNVLHWLIFYFGGVFFCCCCWMWMSSLKRSGCVHMQCGNKLNLTHHFYTLLVGLFFFFLGKKSIYFFRAFTRMNTLYYTLTISIFIIIIKI